ncbi:phospholipase-like protein [Tanacetum coccineum]
MSDFYDVKISVRSSVKLLPEIKGLLSVKRNHERLFRDTVFGLWLDIQSHDNDSHMMHYVLQHQGEYMWDKSYQRTVNVVSKHTEYPELKKNPNFNATYNLYGFAWAFKIWILESYTNSKKWWSKKANVIPRGLAWLKVKSPEEMRQSWFMASVEFIKGLDDQDSKFIQDDEARVNCIEHNNEMCGDTEVGKLVQDEEARVNGIEHHNGMCGDTEVGNFVQVEEARVNGIEHQHGMCGDTEDGNFVEKIDETIYPKTNQMSVEEGDGVLDSEGDGVHLSQTNDVIQEAVNLSTMSSTSPQAINPALAEFFSEFDALKKEVFLLKKCKDDEFDELTKRFSKLETSETFEPSFSSSHPGNDKDASHLDDRMEIDGENILHTIKPNDAYDVVEKPVKSSLNDMELEQEPDKIAVKQGILEQQPNAPKVNTIVFKETVRVKVEEKPRLRRGLGPLKVKKKNCQRALRPNYVLRSAKDRKKKLAMALKPPFGQQSATTLVPKKRKSRIMKTEVIVPPFGLEDISGQPRIRSINDIMTHEPFVENLSRPDDCKSDKVVLFGYLCPVLTLHLDLWIDLMWSLRPPEADWAIVSPHFSTCILSGMMPDYFSNGHMYPLPWQAVEKVYFLVNEPKTHWCLVELEIRTGAVTFFDFLGWVGGSRRRWWRRMKKLLPEKLSVYLVMHGIFQSKGISADDYKITYKYVDAPFQASLFGDCGIWVCIFIYRLCRNLPLIVDDPLETALAYRERMLEYFWSHKILVERTSSVV